MAEGTPGQWEQVGETVKTCFGDLTLDAPNRLAIYTVEVKEVTRFRMLMALEDVERTIRQLEWARNRLQPPWTGDPRPPKPPAPRFEAVSAYGGSLDPASSPDLDPDAEAAR